MDTLNLFRNLYRKWKRRGRNAQAEVSEVITLRYARFRDLLDSNSQLLGVISDIETKLEGRQIFGMSYVRSQASRAGFHALRMVKSLNQLSGHMHESLYDVVDRINDRIREALGEGKQSQVAELVLPYSLVTRETAPSVGGKSANLGEVRNRVRLEVPAGFAITTQAYFAFLAYKDVIGEVNRKRSEIDPEDPKTIQRISEEIRELILAAEMPPELIDALRGAYSQLAEGRSPGPMVSLRSSAIGEDSELSHAGQYLSILNVSGEKLISAYREVVASLYAPRAVAYRLNRGIRDEELAMSVACLEMIDSVASGVIYSRHPSKLGEPHIIVTAVWGLGPYAVDGTISPDVYTVAREPDGAILRMEVTRKPVELVCDPEGGVRESAVEPERRDRPCLSPEQIRVLAGYCIRLEEHYQTLQDIEWALDRKGRLLVLQARPLRVEAAERQGVPSAPDISGYPVLIEGGAIAFQGVGCGPAVHVRSDSDLLAFPAGGVLVAKKPSTKYVLVMSKTQAIVTESGSVAGHMAAVAREFSVPCLVNTRIATSVIPQGVEVTVDAFAGRVYRGRVPELLELRKPKEAPMRDTPVYQALRRVADLVVPLHLLDPKSPDFGPQSCTSFHDLGRLVHELSYGEMFRVSDLVPARGEGALKLDAPIPLDLYIIDLWDGLSGVRPGSDKATLEHIVSAPMKSFVEGMLHQAMPGSEPRAVDFGGLLSVMREQMLAPPPVPGGVGERSYAIISRKYLNFSSRVGYHFCVLDTYCGGTINKNYITFSFKGGAADETRRNRRVRAIALILEALNFDVEVTSDRVDARLQKDEASAIAGKLERIGRLLIHTRQMDMLMKSEESVEAVAQDFLRGLG